MNTPFNLRPKACLAVSFSEVSFLLKFTHSLEAVLSISTLVHALPRISLGGVITFEVGGVPG